MKLDLDSNGSIELGGLIFVLLCVAVILLGDIVTCACRLRARLNRERNEGRTHVRWRGSGR